jgi:hypothetical protein
VTKQNKTIINATRKYNLLATALVGELEMATPLVAQETVTAEYAYNAGLTMQLQNPVASLISVPIQNNWDFGIGPANAMRYTANIQPGFPFPSARTGTSSSALSCRSSMQIAVTRRCWSFRFGWLYMINPCHRPEWNDASRG